MTRASAALASLLLLPASTLWAASSSDKGTAAGLSLGLGPGARAAALGEAYTAVVDEASAMYWNPAALSRIEKRSVQFMHGNYLNVADFEYLAFGHNIGRFGAWGLGVQSFSAKGINQTDASGVGSGTFSTDDTAFSLGWAMSVPASSGTAWSGAAFGVTAKAISARVATTAHAYAFDVGLLSPKLWGDRLRLAATTSNMGTKLKFDRDDEKLPSVTRLGAALRPTSWWLASADVAIPNYDAPYFAFGSEMILGATQEVRAAEPAGFNTKTLSDVTGFTGFSFGVGLAAGGWDFDYGMVPFGALGLTHRFSISVKF